MPAKITLKVSHGKLFGKEFVFEDRNTCIVGRGEDCMPQLPNDSDHTTISRNHCLLDINPPDIRIRDFGSRNGTYVNDKKIGQRPEGQTPEEAAKLNFPEFDLKDGDQVKLGDTIFQVSVYSPAICATCTKEIPEAKRLESKQPNDQYKCADCVKKAGAAVIANKQAPKRACGICGKDIAKEANPTRDGIVVCSKCQTDPMQIMKLLLDRAKAGNSDVTAIQGYTLIKELGRGGMGAVYLARHEKSGEQVALKVMLPKIAANERSVKMFLRETENTRALKNPNVVQLRDSGFSNGTFFFTLEFCDGGSVDQLMSKRGGKLPVEEAMGIILQTLDGLEYAHTIELPERKSPDGPIAAARGLVHRDLKPGNIFLAGSGRSSLAKVADFGMSKAFDNAGLSGQTRTGDAAGSPWYMPRQQVINFKYAKPNVDVWAAAASLYNMLTGFTPRDFPRGEDPWRIVLQKPAVPILQRGIKIPAKLAAVIDEAVVDQPSIKFSSAGDLKRALKGAY